LSDVEQPENIVFIMEVEVEAEPGSELLLAD